MVHKFEHKFEKSLPYETGEACPAGYHKRAAYSSVKGKYVPARCVAEAKKCPPGYTRREAYTRRFSTATRKAGYVVKRKSGKMYTVFPTASSQVVESACIPTRKETIKRIGPLKKGELTRFGYSSFSGVESRHAALKKAVEELGALNIYHKLDAVAKLGVRVAPEASKIFAADRDWVRSHYFKKSE
jgi:hypothetical protein